MTFCGSARMREKITWNVCMIRKRYFHGFYYSIKVAGIMIRSHDMY